MVIRHTIITTVILLFLLSLIPAEWKIIYRHIHSNKDYQPIIIPVSGTSHQAIENTYGASRPGGREHQGIDIFAPHGTPVLNAIDGIVLYTGRDTYGGNVVRILGIDKRMYYYAHLRAHNDFEAGETVDRGDVIGYVGNTGNAITTPPHLHFEIMEIQWLLPLKIRNVNPYNELMKAIDIQ
jgi:peptidoglycan LD-endopeptidase LytH